MIDPTGITSFLATMYIADSGASVADPSANSRAVPAASCQDGRFTVEGARRHSSLFPSDVFARSPIAVAGGRIDVLGPYDHRCGIGGPGQAASIYAGANLCLFRGTVSDGATDGLHNFTLGRTGKGKRLSPTKTFIWQTERIRGEGEPLCELPIGDDESAFGITYDPLRQSLWVQVGPEFAVPGGAYRMLEVGLDGIVRSAVPGPAIGVVGLLAGMLAMDHEDQSRWWIQSGEFRHRPGIAHVGLRFDRIGQRLSYYFLEPREASGAPAWSLRPLHGTELELSAQLSDLPVPSLFAAAA